MSETRTNGNSPPLAAEAEVEPAAPSLQHLLYVLRISGGAWLLQAGLHLQLLRSEWGQERIRLRRLIVATLLGFAFLLGLVGTASAVGLALFWDTRYRLAAAAVLLLAFGLGLALAWQRCRALMQLGEHSFADSRRELAADCELLGKPL
jgi:uncharacterized membrane protein YqjE